MGPGGGPRGPMPGYPQGVMMPTGVPPQGRGAWPPATTIPQPIPGRGGPPAPPHMYGVPGQAIPPGAPMPGAPGYPNYGMPQGAPVAAGRGGPLPRGPVPAGGAPGAVPPLQQIRPNIPPAGRGVPQQGARPGPARPQGARPEGEPGVINAAVLAQAPPQQQKQMLGEAIYPKIHATQPELAGKITGMLLEMDNAELLNL